MRLHIIDHFEKTIRQTCQQPLQKDMKGWTEMQHCTHRKRRFGCDGDEDLVSESMSSESAKPELLVWSALKAKFS